MAKAQINFDSLGGGGKTSYYYVHHKYASNNYAFDSVSIADTSAITPPTVSSANISTNSSGGSFSTPLVTFTHISGNTFTVTYNEDCYAFATLNSDPVFKAKGTVDSNVTLYAYPSGDSGRETWYINA